MPDKAYVTRIGETVCTCRLTSCAFVLEVEASHKAVADARLKPSAIDGLLSTSVVGSAADSISKIMAWLTGAFRRWLLRGSHEQLLRDVRKKKA